MKILLIFIFPLLMFDAIAASGVGGLVGGSGNGRISDANNWNEIRAAVKLNKKLKITGDYAYVGQIVSIFDVCTDGKHFITTNKLPVYKSVRVSKHMDNDGERDGWTNKIVGYEHRSYPLSTFQTKRKCDHHGKNCRYVEVEFTQDTQKEVTVEKFLKEEGSQRKEIFKKVFSKDYFVPNCK